MSAVRIDRRVRHTNASDCVSVLRGAAGVDVGDICP
jgi:hypothetical protein